MNIAGNFKTFEKRNHPRTAYAGPIFFATKDRLYEGELKNFSRFGLGIRTSEPPPIDEIITVALPFSDSRQGKFMGQIVWSGNGQFGVELFKKRTGPQLRVIK